MDRYADRLDEAVGDALDQADGDADAAKMRPNDDDNTSGKECAMQLTWGFGGALGGTRTPNLLIRSQMLYPLSYERSN